MKEICEGMTVDELLGEIVITGDVEIDMTLEIPRLDGTIKLIKEHRKIRDCRVIIRQPTDMPSSDYNGGEAA